MADSEESPTRARQRADRQTVFLKAYSKNLASTSDKTQAFDAGLLAVYMTGYYAGRGRRRS